MNKFLILVLLFTLVLFVTACAVNKPSGKEEDSLTQSLKEPKDYIVTTKIPTTTRSGLVDNAEPGYVAINPTYTEAEIPADKGKIEWFDTGLGARIPAFPEGKLLEVINTDDNFVAYIANVSEDDFRQYFETLFANGYIGDINTWEGFTLFNPMIAINMRYLQEPGRVTTIRARKMKNDEFEKMKSQLKTN